MPGRKIKPGANILENNGVQFRVWAPFRKHVSLRLIQPDESIIQMESIGEGWFECIVKDAEAGTRYLYELDKIELRPDPASAFQPEGVHGPSEVIDHNSHKWKDINWKNIPLQNYIFYELHVATFTPEGTFDSIIPYISYLKELGITAVQLMPISQFPGKRNWGYDSVYPYSVQNTYGGPDELKHLVESFHMEGIAVTLDVVYNHLGPEGNYFGRFGPYFTDKYKTPWGDAINFDGPDAKAVREYFIYNALYWAENFHIDALRLDAVHGIFDSSKTHILRELSDEIKNHTNMYLIAESDLNDPRVINSVESGGYGLHAQWNDDFHHSVHTLLTKENSGYYMDFGQVSHLKKTLSDGFVYSGQRSKFRGQNHGGSTSHIDPWRFVHFLQNHDQVGNRPLGDRLCNTIDTTSLKLGAALSILSPSLPLIFMGEEYAEKSPFNYFIDHSDKRLKAAIQKGRKEEFKADVEIPDPADPEIFMLSKLEHSLKESGKHNDMLNYYRSIIRLRKSLPALNKTRRDSVSVSLTPDSSAITMSIDQNSQRLFYIINFSDQTLSIPLPEEFINSEMLILLNTSKWLMDSEPESVKIEGNMDIAPSSMILAEIQR